MALENLKRLKKKKCNAEDLDELVAKSLQVILSVCSPTKVILFGSAVSGAFDEDSDLDFVMTFPTLEEALSARKNLYRSRSKFLRSADFICVDDTTFQRKSALGGVLFDAANSGRVLYTGVG